MPMDTFGARSQLQVGDASFEIVRLDALDAIADTTRLPFSLKILLENLLRHENGTTVTHTDVEALARWNPAAVGSREIAFTPARVLMQDFTGVPAMVDLAAMRDAMEALGADPAKIDPRVPVELIIDHSVIADVSGRPDAFRRNAELEFTRNRERYELLRWAQEAFANVKVMPPDSGICHQVNLEYLARVVFVDDNGCAYPDTLVGTDSHTPMVNGLGVLGWGVGGIEAEAAMLGEPLSLLLPAVVGIRLVGQLPEGSTATDLVLTIAERLRHHGVVGKFVEFYGPGVATVPLENRATIGNMSPEYGSTCAIFPIDAETIRYLRFTGRPPQQIALVEAYAKEQGLFHEPGSPDPTFSETIEVDLTSVVPSIAGPARPHDRVPLTDARRSFRRALVESRSETNVALPPRGPDEASAQSFPASDPPASNAGTSDPAPLTDRPEPPPSRDSEPLPERVRRPTKAVLTGGTEVTLDHGAVVIAAITSCTNTSNPSVMVAAGLLAKNAVARGLTTKPWVKTSLAPGSRVVTDYLAKAGLNDPLEALGYHLVGYGCTTCIGNSGPLLDGVSDAVNQSDLAVCAVLSGNRNFEGRIHPDVRMNYLASPPLVVAYAIAGTLDTDLVNDPLGVGTDGQPVFLRDIWPTSGEVAKTIRGTIESDMFRRSYEDAFTGDENWRGLDVATGTSFSWEPSSSYIRRPPFFEGMARDPEPAQDIVGARALAVLGDSITTDHISPAGSIKPDSAAGSYLSELDLASSDFNSYGARRGNHEVMVRGTFANVRLRNQLAPGTEGAYTLHLPDGELSSIYDAAIHYRDQGVPLVVLAGADYGAGSSRDWAAKGTLLLGVRAVLARSFERIHRSNLVDMGVLPLEFVDGDSVESLGLTGREVYEIRGLAALGSGAVPERLTVRADDMEFAMRPRIDTTHEAAYYRHGGILTYVLRQLATRT
ncbi:MAG: aconitate hydratase [Ilumatobacteraceae bacterium]